MHITTAGMDELVLLQGIDTPWNWLIGITIFISRKSLGIWVSKLSTCSCTPGIEMTSSQNCNCMGLTTGNLLDILVFQSLNHFWHWLVWTAVLILGHTLGIRMAKLATTASSPRVKSSF
jgi:hypothetical protein